MRNVGVHPAFFVDAFDQMAYEIHHNAVLRPKLISARKTNLNPVSRRARNHCAISALPFH